MLIVFSKISKFRSSTWKEQSFRKNGFIGRFQRHPETYMGWAQSKLLLWVRIVQTSRKSFGLAHIFWVSLEPSWRARCSGSHIYRVTRFFLFRTFFNINWPITEMDAVDSSQDMDPSMLKLINMTRRGVKSKRSTASENTTSNQTTS